MDDPHNQYLHVIAEYGFIGFSLLGVVLFLIAKTIPQQNLRAFSVFVAGDICGYASELFFQWSLVSFRGR